MLAAYRTTTDGSAHISYHPKMQLLAIIEVDQQRRVYCQAPGCTRTVYKEIHIIEDEGDIRTLGSTCYKVLFGHERAQTPLYTGSTTKVLTDVERALLAENTRALIDKFKNEREVSEASIETTDITNEIAPAGPLPSISHKDTRIVLCSYCNSRMETALRTRPARGYRCDTCKTSGLSDRDLKQRNRRTDR